MDLVLNRKFYLISSVYLLPLMGWTLLTLRELPVAKGLFYLGLGWMVMGACGLYLYLKFSAEPQKPVPAPIPAPFLEEIKKERDEYLLSIEKLQHEKGVIELEKVTTEKEMERLRSEVLQLKMGSIEALRQKERELQEAKKQLHEHRHQIEEKQTLLQTLQGKVSDLTFEIKTLVEVHNRQEEPQFKAIAQKEPGERLLKRCLDHAKKYVGSHLFHGIDGRESLSLDQRRLFDSFLEEKSGVVFYFSPKEGKILFVNSAVEDLLGCSSETFRFDFIKLIEGSEEAWRQGVQQLSKTAESEFDLQLKLTSGKEGLFRCVLGRIPSGLFRNDVIGTLT